MKYEGKSTEVIGSKILFEKETLRIHILEDNSFAKRCSVVPDLKLILTVRVDG